ncbi:hypothetical protein AALO_G00038880, partial [Alosa alosa]
MELEDVGCPIARLPCWRECVYGQCWGGKEWCVARGSDVGESVCMASVGVLRSGVWLVGAMLERVCCYGQCWGAKEWCVARGSERKKIVSWERSSVTNDGQRTTSQGEGCWSVDLMRTLLSHHALARTFFSMYALIFFLSFLVIQ